MYLRLVIFGYGLEIGPVEEAEPDIEIVEGDAPEPLGADEEPEHTVPLGFARWEDEET